MANLTELTCPGCSYACVCTPPAILDWLRQAKMMRRDVRPDPELMGELFRAAVPKLICPRCGAKGLVLRPVAEEKD